MGKNTCKNLVIYRNTSKVFELIFKRDGVGEDITGWTIYFTVKASMQDSDANAVIKKDVTSHLDASNGKSAIEVTPDDTVNLTPRAYDYDIKAKTDEGYTAILYHGKLLIREPVTTRG